MHFICQKGFFSSPVKQLKVSVIYYDDIEGSTWQFQYDAGRGNFLTAFTVTCTGSDTWKTHTVMVADAVMQRNGPKGCDFALVNRDQHNDIFHRIEIEKLNDDNPSDTIHR